MYFINYTTFIVRRETAGLGAYSKGLGFESHICAAEFVVFYF